MRNTTICINHREDPKIHWTIANIKRTCHPCPEIIVIDDGGSLKIDGVKVIHNEESMGTSFARHVGVQNATNERVITMDSHIDFADGWLEVFENALDKNKNRIVCGKCKNVSQKGIIVGYHAGANLEIYVETNSPVSGKWRDGDDPTGEVACLMGGCYGLNKSWYEQIGEPWKYGRGWGSDEESISLATRLMGGDVHCLDVDINHVYQHGTTYSVTASDCIRALYNKARMVVMLPVSATKQRTLMLGLIGESPHRNEVNAIIRETGIRDYGKWIKENSMVKLKTIMEQNMVLANKKKTVRKKETKPRIQNKIVTDKGVCCPHCGNAYDHRIQNTYPNGNRRVLCGKKNSCGCGKPFIIRRKTV